MRYTSNFKLALYDLGDKYSNQYWNNNFSKLDTELDKVKVKTDNLNQDTAIFITSVIAPNFIGNADTATKLKTSRSIQIGNKSLSFDGSKDITYTLDDMGIAAKEHTHSYLPLTNGTLVNTTLSEQIFYNAAGSWQAGLLGTAAIRKNAINDDKVSFIHYKSLHGAYTLSTYGDIGITIEYASDQTITTSNSYDFQAVLLNSKGYTSFPVKVSCPEFIGKLTGNANTTTKLQTPRSINGTAFDGSTDITTNTWGTTRTITIGNRSGNYNGGANLSYSLAEIGAHPSANKIDANAVTHSNYPNNGTTHVPTMNFMSYWNGAYNNLGNSNLQYCDRGRFGTIITKNAGDYSLINHNHDSNYLKLSGGTVTGDLVLDSSINFTHSNGGQGIYGPLGDTDGYRIIGVSTGYDEGYLEIATGDNGNEPIYVRQYGGGTNTFYGTVIRTATLLDETGNTIFPGDVTAGGNLHGNDLFLIGNITTELGNTNHHIKLGHGGDDIVKFYEYGGAWDFVRSQNGNNFTCFNIRDGGITVYASGGEGGQILLTAPADNAGCTGVYMDNYYGTFRLFGAASANGEWRGSGEVFTINPYNKSFNAGGYNGNFRSLSSGDISVTGSVTVSESFRGKYYTAVSGDSIASMTTIVRSSAPPTKFGGYALWAN